MNSSFFQNNGAQRPFSYIINSVEISFVELFATAYDFTLDTVGTVFSGDVTGNFSDNADASTALTELATATTTMFPTVTASAISSITAVPGAIEIDCSNVEWDGSGNVLVYLYGNWNENGEGVNEFVFLSGSELTTDQPTFATEFADEMETEINSRLDTANGFTLTRVGNVLTLSSTGRLSFYLSELTTNPLTFSYENDLSTPPTTNILTPVADAAMDVGGVGEPRVNVGVFPSSQISLDTNQTADLEQSLTITANTGINTIPTLTSATGGPTGIHTTYSVFDYAGMEITTFTGSVSATSESDFTTVNNQIIAAINSNTETPYRLYGCR